MAFFSLQESEQAALDNVTSQVQALLGQRPQNQSTPQQQLQSLYNTSDSQLQNLLASLLIQQLIGSNFQASSMPQPAECPQAPQLQAENMQPEPNQPQVIATAHSTLQTDSPSNIKRKETRNSASSSTTAEEGHVRPKSTLSTNLEDPQNKETSSSKVPGIALAQARQTTANISSAGKVIPAAQSGAKTKPSQKRNRSAGSSSKASKRTKQTNAEGVASRPLPVSTRPSGPIFLLNEDHREGSVPGLLFPWKLHDMLDAADQQGNNRESTVSWQEDGVSFKIRDKERFVRKIVPKYFHKTTWDDFMKTLSSWGFVRFTSGAQKGAFIHRLLVRRKRSLCKQMRINGKKVRAGLFNEVIVILSELIL
jgi:hypothetical protein